MASTAHPRPPRCPPTPAQPTSLNLGRGRAAGAEPARAGEIHWGGGRRVLNAQPRQSQPRSCPQWADPCQWISAQRCPHPTAPMTAAAPRQTPGASSALIDMWHRLVRDEQSGQGGGQNHQRCPPLEPTAGCHKQGTTAHDHATPSNRAGRPTDRMASSATCTARRAHLAARTGHQAQALRGRAGQGSARLARQARWVRRSWDHFSYRRPLLSWGAVSL